VKDITGQDIHLGDRVAYYNGLANHIYIGRVADLLVLTNRVIIDIELISDQHHETRPPGEGERGQISGARTRVLVLR